MKERKVRKEGRKEAPPGNLLFPRQKPAAAHLVRQHNLDALYDFSQNAHFL